MVVTESHKNEDPEEVQNMSITERPVASEKEDGNGKPKKKKSRVDLNDAENQIGPQGRNKHGNVKRKHMALVATNIAFALICFFLFLTFPGEVDADEDEFRHRFYGTVGMFMILQIIYGIFNVAMMYTGCFFTEKGERMCVKIIFHVFIIIVTVIAIPVVLVAYKDSPYNNTVIGNPCGDIIENYFGDQAIDFYCQEDCPCNLSSSLYSSSDLQDYETSTNGAVNVGECTNYASGFDTYAEYVYKRGGDVDSSFSNSSRPWELDEWVAYAAKREKSLNCIWACSYRPYYLFRDATDVSDKPDQTCFDALVEQFDEYYPYVVIFCLCLISQIAFSVYSISHSCRYRSKHSEEESDSDCDERDDHDRAQLSRNPPPEDLIPFTS